LLAGLALAYGALTRETVMVAVGAIAIVRIIGLIRARRAPGRDEQAWVLPGVVFAAWQLVIYAVTGSLALATDSGRNAGLPFAAPLRALAHNARHVTADVSILEICLVNPNTWSRVNSAMRSFIEVYLVAVVILLSVPAGRLGARFAWVLPALGAWMVPVAAGVVHRGLTIPSVCRAERLLRVPG
jgi:hypothetical protein